jgi:hypothetical protein
VSELRIRLGEPSVYLFEPAPAPRMSKSSAWSQAPGMLRYKAFCREARRRKIELPVPFVVEFHIAGKGEPGSPHLQKPDTDNLVKGLIDAVYWRKKGGDSHVYALCARKLWSEAESHFIVWPVLQWHLE